MIARASRRAGAITAGEARGAGPLPLHRQKSALLELADLARRGLRRRLQPDAFSNRRSIKPDLLPQYYG